MAQIEVKMKLDMPPGVEVLGYERRGRGHQQQGPGDYQALLRREVVGHALEPADPGPESGLGGGGENHRRATRNHVRPEGRISRVLHLKPEEPYF